ncbi:DUF6517 family protein [Natronosalvus vescus]|uniref:DUF6517 family protein n=1 Tax=Natronosalvus vescus TaxID=2953881 RepID=UPI0020917A2B|nr:DUF6517 family protein [Natronosalvus vescus]
MHRRNVLTGAGVVGIASLSGCLGVLGLDSHESKPAGVDEGVLADTGYEQTKVEPIGIEEEFDAVLYTETIRVTNYLTEHEKAIDLGPLGRQRAAVFMVLTTPKVEVAGRELNPVEDMSTDELVSLVEDNYDDIGDITHQGDESVTILGEGTTVSQFSADAQFDGQDVDVRIHVSEAVQTDDDLVVAIGIYPEQTRDQEGPNVGSLMEGIIEDAHDDS